MLDSLDTVTYGAWHGALFAKAEKLPDLGEILLRMRERKKRAPRGTLEQFDAWAVQINAVQGANKP